MKAYPAPSTLNYQEYPTDLVLKQVTLVHRHGARSPVFDSATTFPTIPKWKHCNNVPSFFEAFHTIHKNNHALDIRFEGAGAEQIKKQMDLLNSGEWSKSLISFPGQLTDEGKKGMEEFGASIRSLYHNKLGLISSIWNTASSAVYLRSTNYLRTVESLQYLLHGLYPKDSIIGLPKITVKDTLLENMYPHNSCSTMVADMKNLRLGFSEKNKDRLLSVLNPLSFWHTMDNQTHANQAYRLYDMLSCLQGNDIAFPKGVTEDHYGRFLPELTEPIQEAHRNNPDAPKLAIFSGHDSTLVPLLVSFKAFQGQYPQFGSNIAIEYFQKDDRSREGFVRMLYNSQPVKIPGCAAVGSHYKSDTSICTFGSFMKQVQAFSMTEEEYQSTCHSDVVTESEWD